MQLESDAKPPGFIERYCEYILETVDIWRHRPFVRLLDVGCGNGAYVSKWNNHIDAEGIDKYACNHDTYGDAEKEIPYPDEYFDVVHSKSLIEHTKNIEQVILEMHRVLRADGVCVMLTPDIEKAKWGFYGDIGHVTPFNNSKLYQLLDYADFTKVSVSRFTQWPHGWKKPLKGMLIATGVK
jgi:ubiquinone/menaquinone biosynthesis C-methylase UbiE